MGKSGERLGWHGRPLCTFWTIWCKTNRVSLDNEESLDHRMKSYFLCNLLSWRNLCIVDSPGSLFDFFGLVRL